MDTFKTGPTGLLATALVSLGKSGRFHLVWYQIRSKMASFSSVLRDGQKLPKHRLWRICIKKKAKIKMNGSIIGRAKQLN